MIYGITPQGFVRKPFQVIRAEIEADARTLFGADVDLSDMSPIGAETALMAMAIDRQWQLAEDVYYSLWISSAEGVNLDRVARLGFVSRQPAAFATVYLTFTGATGAEIPAGLQAETAQGVIFETIESGLIGMTGEGTVLARCAIQGTVGLVQPGMINAIKTPIAGIDEVINNSSSTGGRGRESDVELRDRYSTLPSSTGASTEAIYSALRNLEGVITVRVFENILNVVDANGLPPKSIECVVNGGDEIDIATMIFAKKPAGIDLFGGMSVMIVDAQGIERTIYFSRPEDKSVYVTYTLTVNSAWSEEFADIIISNAVKYIGGVDNLLVEYEGVGIAQPVIAWKLIAAQAGVGGIETISVKLGFEEVPEDSENLTFLPRERPRTDALKINVVIL